MNFSKSDQLLIGLVLSVATALGIMMQSSSLALATLMLGAFFLVPGLFARGVTSTSKSVARFSYAVAAVWLIAFFGGILGTAERIYYVNGNSYPRWLASGGLASADEMDALRQGECKGRGPLEISEKADGLFVVRCGTMWWESKTYLADFNPVRTAP
ncbi:hypothetical protein [Acidovorax sp.]|uniref:hypothetical protein n=1 Tax=Acidovorax sp. TaxID=1872122 RepID=UPI00391F681A